MLSAGALRQKHLSKIPSLDADILLQLSCNKEKTFLLTHPEYKFTCFQTVKFFYLLFRYHRGTPIAYLAGHKEFFGLDFMVNKHTLIPRPDTEVLVEEAIKILNSGEYSALIDVGTGSGCIPIAILNNTQKTIAAFATDISAGASRTAKKNAALHKVKINYSQGNLLESLKNIPEGKILVTANLPYLTDEQFAGEPSIQKEPRTALVAAENGLALYRELLEQFKNLNRSFTALFEFDPSQTEIMKKLIGQHFPDASVEIKKDLSGQDRVVKIISE